MILHLANDYSGSAVYKNLVQKLDDLHIPQIVYTPLRNKKLVGRNQVNFNDINSKIIYSHILSKYTDKLFYKRKINKIIKDIEDKIDLSKVSFIHAHTWYSDGGVAYELHKKYKIPYIIAVRNSDINLFLKYRIFNRGYGRKIIINSYKIISISAVYKKRLLEDSRLASIRKKLNEDLLIVPNGVDDFWIKNKVNLKKSLNNFNVINLLFIGNFNKGKNVINLIKAVKSLNSKQIKFHLTLIGGGGNDEKNIKKTIHNLSFINYIGKIHNLEIIKNYFQNADFFTMPSKSETFGLVYIEALLQGLPILYTKNEGVDGFYDDSVGEKINNISAVEIEKKITNLVLNHEKYSFNIEAIAENHNWKNIALIYKKIYYN